MNDFRTTIDVAKNGYIVRPSDCAARDYSAPIAEHHVFESFEALVEHLRSRLPIYPAFDPIPAPVATKRR